MNEPRTELDPRFSDPDPDPDTEPTGWRDTVSVIQSAHEDGDHGPVHVYEVRPVKTQGCGRRPFTHTRHTPKDRL